MPFIKGDERAAEAGRKRAAQRWTGASAEAKAAENQRMNTARLAQYIDLAHEQALRMGIILSPSQAAAAGAALLKADLRDRLAIARAVKATMLATGGPEPTTEEWRNDRTVREAIEA